ncbi:MAG: F0F1 ATP synthase subunit delta [Helicobacteraceae bacterium]|jgi:F-type H+-transporting ATPase subunit delta|nr:F0F1 ATP synthase subunit delta [Helicobacteraceae bacterium]
MNDKLAAKRYATALISVSKDKELERILTLLESVSKLFANKKFVEIAKSPLVSAQEKSELLISVLQEKPIKLTNLIMLLADKSRLMALPDIAKEVRFMLAGKQSTYNGVVYSHKPLDEAKVKKLAAALTKRLNADIRLTQSDKPYNGVKVSIDELGVEADFSQTQIRSQILGHILRGL